MLVTVPLISVAAVDTSPTLRAISSTPEATTARRGPVCAWDSTPFASADATDALGWGHDGRRCPPLGARARQGQRLRAHPVRTRPGARPALGRLPPARRQDPGAHRGLRRLPAYPAHPLARGRPDLPRDG